MKYPLMLLMIHAVPMNLHIMLDNSTGSLLLIQLQKKNVIDMKTSLILLKD